MSCHCLSILTLCSPISHSSAMQHHSDMETLLIPSPPATDFKSSAQSSVCSTPFTSAPSSPPRHNNDFFFFNDSAPSSPTTSAKHYAQFTHNPSLRDANFILSSPPEHSSSVPFDWEESPGIPKNRVRPDDSDDRPDFEFDFSGQLDRNSLCADELFDGGKIKPLKPPPRLQVFNNDSETELSNSNRFKTAHSSPRSSSGSNILYSPRRKQAVIDPFTKALEEARKARASDFNFNPKHIKQSRGRGMSITTTSTTTTTPFSHKKTRSLSPFRVSDIIADSEHQQDQATTSSFWGSFWLPKAYRKWRIKDLLFRSASEGRATEKLAVAEDVESRMFMENSSFRSVETTASEVSMGSTSKRKMSNRNRVPVSAHELHYKLNRAVSQEMRKKTYLPYKQGLLGCLGFVPGGGGSEVSRNSTGSMARV